MEKRNWNDFRHSVVKTASDEQHSQYRQEFLQPSLSVEVRFTYADEHALIRTYQQVLDLLGDSFMYHNGNRIGNREKAFSRFPALVENPKSDFFYNRIADTETAGSWAKGKKPAVTGGIGCAEFSYSIRKCTQAKWDKAIAELGKYALKGEIRREPAVSVFNIRIPTETFADAESFSDWVLSLEIMQSPTLYSASAGYFIKIYDQHTGTEAEDKLAQILTDHPGFGYNVIPIMQERYSFENKIIRPVVSRISWLNILSDGIFLFFPGGREGFRESAAVLPDLILHALPYGIAVQAGPQPGIGDRGKAPEAYYRAAEFLEDFTYFMEERELRDAEFIDWQKHFYTPGMTVKRQNQAAELAALYIE